VECRLYVSETGQTLMAYVQMRNDKSHPNSIRTIIATLTNLQENIQVEELLGPARSGLESERCSDFARKLPIPAGSESSSHGGAALANVAVGDALDAQRFSLSSGTLGGGR